MATTTERLDSIIRNAAKLKDEVAKRGLDGDPVVDEMVANVDNDLDEVAMFIGDLS